MTVRDALREGVAALGASETAFLDASLLLAAALGLSRTALYAAGPQDLSDSAEVAYRAYLDERSGGQSVAYILGEKEFWGRSFRVDARVLVPRPETELLVCAAIEAGDVFGAGSAEGRTERRADGSAGRGRPAPRVHEACCGSGCVILSIAADRPEWNVSASDLSEGALAVARENAFLILAADRPGGPCLFSKSDLLGSVDGPFDILIANPPYIPSAEIDGLGPELRREPRLALDGGPDGLDLYRRLVPQAAARLVPGGTLLLESDGAQAARLRSLLAEAGFAETSTLRDLAGIERVTLGSLPWKT